MINLGSFFYEIETSRNLYPEEEVGFFERYYNSEWDEISPLEYDRLEEEGEEVHVGSKEVGACYLLSEEETEEWLNNYDVNDIDSWENNCVYLKISDIGANLLISEDYYGRELLDVNYKMQNEKPNKYFNSLNYNTRKIDYNYIAELFDIDTTIKDKGLLDELLELQEYPEYISEYDSNVESLYYNRYGDLISLNNWLECQEYGLEGECIPKTYEEAYLIRESDAYALKDNTDETVLYFSDYDLYFWLPCEQSYYEGVIVNLDSEQLEKWENIKRGVK